MSDVATEVCAAGACSENECEAPSVSEVDDVVHGSEPGASRFSLLIPTDSYDDFAKLAESRFTDASFAGLSHGTIEQLKDNTDSNSEPSVADDGRLKSDRLKPPEPIFARIDTPSSLSEDDADRQRSSAAQTDSNQSDDSRQQITVQSSINVLFC